MQKNKKESVRFFDYVECQKCLDKYKEVPVNVDVWISEDQRKLLNRDGHMMEWFSNYISALLFVDMYNVYREKNPDTNTLLTSYLCPSGTERIAEYKKILKKLGIKEANKYAVLQEMCNPRHKTKH